MIASLPTLLTTDQIADLARSLYGLDARASRLPGEIDLNFLLEVSTGERYIFKVSAKANAERLEMQHRAMAHVARAGIALPTQVVVPARDGRELVPLPSVNGTDLLGRVLTWLPGRLWVETPSRSTALYRDLGRRLGELDVALQGFDHPAARRDDLWDVGQALRHRPRIPLVTSPARRVLIEGVFHLLAAGAAPHFGALRRSVIHGDANDYNLLVSDDGLSLSGLLDFGDMVESFTICELAVALAYVSLGESDLLRVGAEIVAGYHEVFPLQELELEVLFPLVCGRLAASCMIAAERRAAGSIRAYHFVTEEPAWAALERLVEINPADAVESWRAVCGLASGEDLGASPAALLAVRQQLIGPSLSVSYDEPLKLVRGLGQYLYDHRGRPYLDLVNNVNHVGHCHPRVVAAGARQMALLNTNTRYLYDGLTDYAARLAVTFPEPLKVCFFVCSGSEANELALRLARTHTGRRDVIVLEGAYHGHTGNLIDISPYKFRGPGGRGEPEPWVHPVPMPDGYRGPYKGFDRAVGERYAAHVERTISESASPVAAFICESMLGCGGQVVFPEGFLQEAYRHVRAAGGVCIADEVQVGFGRIGTHFWAFETQDVVPDIVVLGKPIGNGHPMAAVVTTPEIAESFANGMELFSTFGGNPVSCAIGLAVLDVIEDEGLQQHALEVGERFFAGLSELAERHPLIGTVRGRGLFLGVELVRDRATLEPAVAETAAVVERMRQLGILLSIDGPLHNVIKIKPPLVVTADDIDMVVRCLDRVLEEVAAG